MNLIFIFTLVLFGIVSGCGDNAALRLQSIVPPVKVRARSNVNIGSQEMHSASGLKVSAGVRNISASTKSCNSGGYCMQIGISR